MLDELKVRPAPEEGTIEVPELGTASIVPGAGGFVASIETLRKLAEEGVSLLQIVDTLEEAYEEQEHLYAIAILTTATTGIDNTVYMIPVPEGRHGPRLKVLLDPAHAKRPGGKEATVPFDADTVPPVDAGIERQVRQFIELNRDVLLAYWKGDLATDEFVKQIRPISA
jgi:hypothetical protein